MPIDLEAVWGCGLRVDIPLFDIVLNRDIDDVGFLSRMLSDVLDEYKLGLENIFMLGTSMGGYMSYQYALRQPVPLQGLISIAGSMGLAIEGMDGVKRVPICDFHSTTDEIVPYGGVLPGQLSIRLAMSKPDVLSYWSSTNGTVATPLRVPVTTYPSTNDITVSKLTYVHATHEILHYLITGVPHDYFFHRDSGDCMDYAEEILAFIQSHEVAPPSGAASIADVITIYPNPSHDIVHIGVDQGDVRIYDYSGRLVLAVRIVNGLLDIRTLRAGSYLLHMESAGTRHVMKLIKE
jgi:pimeloyl-ACP methyl ester carboxylesterase